LITSSIRQERRPAPSSHHIVSVAGGTTEIIKEIIGRSLDL